MCLDEAFLGPKYSDLTTWWQNCGPTKTRELIRAPDTTGEPTVAFGPIISPRWGLDPKIWNTWTKKMNQINTNNFDPPDTTGEPTVAFRAIISCLIQKYGILGPKKMNKRNAI